MATGLDVIAYQHLPDDTDKYPALRARVPPAAPPLCACAADGQERQSSIFDKEDKRVITNQ